jgi:hypothetical protein
MNDDAPTAATEGDALPDDLDLNAATLGPYQFPDVLRRRIAGWLYLVVAAGSVAAGAISSNRGMIIGGVCIALVAAYQFACAFPLRIDQTQALAVAGRSVGFAPGHASAQVTWRGLRSKPLWRVVLYSSEEPPKQRGIVELDAVDGSVVFSTNEVNPEDWSKFDVATR